MANELALVNTGALRIVGIPQQQFTIPGGEALVAGQAARLDVTTGKLTSAKGTTAAEARFLGIVTNTPEAVGLASTVVRRGIVDGFDLGALAYDAPIYLSDTDGAISGTTGTVGTVIGRVISGFAAGLNVPDKLLLVEPLA